MKCEFLNSKKNKLLLSPRYCLAACQAAALALACLTAPAGALPHHAPKLAPAILGTPDGPWPFMRRGPNGLETYLIPSQLDQVRRLPEPERSDSLRFIGEHEANLSFFRRTAGGFFPQINSGAIRTMPEYDMDLGEVVLAVDVNDATEANPLFAHEPLLLALPDYTQAVLFVPEVAIPKIRQRLRELALSKRVRIVPSQRKAGVDFGEGITRWVRDIMLAGSEGGKPLLLSSLAHKNFADIAHNDLGYLGRAAGPRQSVLRMPIFFRGGNLELARAAGRKLLLMGAEEMAMNQKWFVEAFGFEPERNAVPEILKRATGADEVLILPNSRNLYHLDMYVTPLADGTLGLLAPVDPQRLTPADRDVLSRASALLKGAGFRIAELPTSAERIGKFQSPANSVSFVDRRSGRHRVLVPQFPEPADLAQPDPARPGLARPDLNRRILDAYRRAGLDPIPVEDRFHPYWGNIHCALVPLH